MVEAYTAGGESPPILMAEIVRFAILFGFKSQCGFCCRPQASKSKAGRGARSSDAPRWSRHASTFPQRWGLVF